MKKMIMTLNDCHSGESSWEGATVVISLEDDVFDEIAKYKSIVLYGDFVDYLWNEDVGFEHDLTSGADGQITAWVSTEPSQIEFQSFPWSKVGYGYYYWDGVKEGTYSANSARLEFTSNGSIYKGYTIADCV